MIFLADSEGPDQSAYAYFRLAWPICSEIYLKKKVREKSRDCHNHKPQRFPDNRQNQTSAYRTNVRKAQRLISSLFPKRDNRNAKRTEKHKNRITQGKTENKSPCRINHKATKNKIMTGTTALERSVE